MLNPSWMNVLAAMVLLSGMIAIATSNTVSWVIFVALAFVAGILLIAVDRKQRS